MWRTRLDSPTLLHAAAFHCLGTGGGGMEKKIDDSGGGTLFLGEIV